jgi:hypothetical protein
MSWINNLKNREHINAVFTNPETIIDFLYFLKIEYESTNNLKITFLLKSCCLIKPKKWLDKGVKDVELTFDIGVTNLNLNIITELVSSPAVKISIDSEIFKFTDIEGKSIVNFVANYFYLMLLVTPHDSE